MLSPEQARAEVARRQAKQALVRQQLLSELHPGQVPIVEDDSATVGVTAGRRFGKSFLGAVKSLLVTLLTTKCNALFVASTRETAKAMVWEPLQELNRKYDLRGRPNQSLLTLTFPNGSKIKIQPVKSKADADKCRGIRRLALVIVDETQVYEAGVLDYLIKDVLKPGQLDLLGDGQVYLLGTPSPLGKIGGFWERWQAPNTSRHVGTIYDNTRLGTREQIEAAVDELLAEEQQTRDGAWFRREILAEWGAVETSDRVYDFVEERNVYTSLPTKRFDNYLIAVDVGFSAADAVGVGGWDDDEGKIYLVRESVKTGQTDQELGDILHAWDREFEPLAIVVDPGALGNKTAASIKQRFVDLPIVAAEKPVVNHQVRTLNTFLRSGRFLVGKGMVVESEIRVPTWKNKIVNSEIIEGPKHSDSVPMCRYLVGAAVAYLPAFEATPTTEAVDRQKREAEDEAKMARIRRAIAKYDPDAAERMGYVDDVDAAGAWGDVFGDEFALN